MGIVSVLGSTAVLGQILQSTVIATKFKTATVTKETRVAAATKIQFVRASGRLFQLCYNSGMVFSCRHSMARLEQQQMRTVICNIPQPKIFSFCCNPATPLRPNLCFEYPAMNPGSKACLAATPHPNELSISQLPPSYHAKGIERP